MSCIPKKIHFVWLGGAIPDFHRLVVERWRAIHPGWEVIVWKEPEIQALIHTMNTGLEERFMRAKISLSSRSDLARYHIVAHEGGIYMDTDFVPLRHLERLISYAAFGAEEQPGRVCSGVFGAYPGHFMFDTVFECLRKRDYALGPVQLAGPEMFGPICAQALRGREDSAVLCPKAFLPVTYGQKDDVNNWLTVDFSRSYAVHLWAESWAGPTRASELALLLRTLSVLANPSGISWRIV